MQIPHYTLGPILLKKIGLIAAFFLILLSAAGMWIYNLSYLQTEDAYINAHVIQIAPRITGKVSHLHVEDNQFVKKGQPLFDIDPQPFEIAVKRAKALVKKAEANVEIAKVTAERVLILSKTKIKSLEEKDQTHAALKEAQAILHQAKTDLAHAQLNLSYTHVTAAADGWVTLMKVREGNMVEANRSLFALVDQKEFWVEANFKETEIKHIFSGQPVSIVADMYPNHPMEGIVNSISRGSGTAFSLLPPQNATGNWVKVTQRVPVKIIITNVDPNFPLRLGTTATVTMKLNPWKKDN